MPRELKWEITIKYISDKDRGPIMRNITNLLSNNKINADVEASLKSEDNENKTIDGAKAKK